MYAKGLLFIKSFHDVTPVKLNRTFDIGISLPISGPSLNSENNPIKLRVPNVRYYILVTFQKGRGHSRRNIYIKIHFLIVGYIVINKYY